VSDGAAIFAIGRHSGPVYDVAFSPDNTIFASAGAESAVMLWSASDGTWLQRLPGHPDVVNAIAFSPDGRFLATAMGAEPPDTLATSVWLWDVATATVIRQLPGHFDGTTSVRFTPDGLSLITGGRDNRIRFWRLSDGANYRVLAGHTHWVRSLAISPDGLTLASGGNDASARLWRLSDGAPLTRLPTSYAVASVAFSPAGNLLATAEEGYGTNVRLWDTSTGAQVRSFAPQPSGFMNAVAFSPVDGALVTSSGQVHSIHVWDPDTGALLAHYDGETSWGLFPFDQPLACTRSGRLGYGRGDATVVVATPAGR